MRTVIFDLDGTLADTSGDLIAAANACFEDLGVGPQLDPERDALTAFHGGRAMLRLGFSRLQRDWDEADVDAQYPRLLQFYDENIDVFTEIYPNVEWALQALSEAGFALGVCTNKPEALAEKLMVRLGLRDRFGALLGADTLPVRKPEPEHIWSTIDALGGARGKSLMIGDTANDRDAAKAAGVPCALVTFGPEGDAVARMKPEALLSDYQELPGLAQSLVAL